MGAASSTDSARWARLESADSPEVGLRLAAALRARWFGASDESTHSKADLEQDGLLPSVRSAILDISQNSVADFLAASKGTPARRELTDAFWELGAFKPYALAAVKADPALSKLSYRCVPKHLSESEFWRLYFVHAYAALAESMADDREVHNSKSRKLTSMTSPKRLPPLSLPRGNSLFLRQEPWARMGGELIWLMSGDSQHVREGRLFGGACLTEGPMAGVAAFALTTPTAVFELGCATPLAADDGAPSEQPAVAPAPAPGTPAGAEWTVCCWFLVVAESSHGQRCLACGSAREQLVCLSDGELGTRSEATGGFLSCGFSVGALAPGWYHLAVVGLRGMTTFSLNGESVGTVDAQCVAPLRFVGNVPPGSLPPQPFGTVADVRAFSRALDEAEIVALARMVPEADRPSVPTAEALRAFARKRAVDCARQKLELAAEMIASADVVLGPSIAPSLRKSIDLSAMRDQLLTLSTSVEDSPKP